MQEKISKQIINERPEAIRVGGDIGGANRLQCCSFCACCGEKEKQNFYFTHHKQNKVWLEFSSLRLKEVEHGHFQKLLLFWACSFINVIPVVFYLNSC